MKVWANAIGYQLVWFAIVWGAANGRGWLAPLALLPFAAWYLSRLDGRIDALLMPLAMAIGVVLDSLLASTQLVVYASPSPSEHAAPIWIVTIWAAFALTLRHSFRFLHGKPLLAGALGAIGAPLAYIGAARGWHAVAFPRGTWPAAAALATGWVVALPAMLAVAALLERRVGSSSIRSVPSVE